MSPLQIILLYRTSKILIFWHLVGIFILFSLVNTSQSVDSVYFQSSTNKTDYISLISNVIRRFKRQNLNSEVNCELPFNPHHGRFILLGDSPTSYKPGDLVNEFISLQLQCNRGYAISPFERNIALCISGIWNPPLATCLRTCPTLISTETTTVNCRLNNKPLENCIGPVTGTRAILSCNPLYEEPNIQKSPIRVCRGNRWYPSASTCYPSCGIKSPKGNSNIIGGQNVTVGDYPWQIGIYNSTTTAFICGGSIIEQNIILTAAHCVTNYEGVVQPAAQYSVAAGKYFSRYNESRDLFAQYSNVLTIHVPDRYTGRINAFALDIAVLILEIHFNLSEGVQPICIALNDDSSDSNFLSASDNGVVTGWGYTIENGEVSDELKELTIPLIPFRKCFSEVPESFRRYFTVDKICGGYLNNRTSICTGDSGSALVFKNLNNNRYFVRGIVSTSPASEALTCDPNQYSLYTSVDHHISFVRDLVIDNQLRTPIECFGDNCPNEENKIEYNQDTTSSNCQIPSYGLHVKYYTIIGESRTTHLPGDEVQQFSLLEVSCTEGYNQNSSSGNQTVCINSKWIPSLIINCLRVCPTLNSTKSTSFKCKYHDLPLMNCINPVEGTTAFLTCNPLYEEDDLQKNLIRLCRVGRWIPPISECYPSKNFLSNNITGACPALNSTKSTSVRCEYNDLPLMNCINPVEGTTAFLTCNPLYEIHDSQKNRISLCRAGRWIPPVIECLPACGLKRPKGTPNIVRDRNATIQDYPWHVGIYTGNTTKELICGGSIVDSNLILTAAHCVTDYEGNVQPIENYFLAAGKYYKNYDDNRDQFAQYSKVRVIYVPERYTGQLSNFAYDIAVIVLTDPFTISEGVQPVCIVLIEESPDVHLPLNSSGIVTGWGYTQEGMELSEALKEFVIQFIPIHNCFEELSNSFRRYLTPEKICFGYLNNGSSVCGGDSGGGLVFMNTLSERYFLKGIVSKSPATAGDIVVCDSNKYSLYTSVNKHVLFIRELAVNDQIRQQSIEIRVENARNEEIVKDMFDVDK